MINRICAIVLLNLLNSLRKRDEETLDKPCILSVLKCVLVVFCNKSIHGCYFVSVLIELYVLIELTVPRRYMFLFCLMFAMSLCASVYMCFVVICWERADLLALICGV